MIFYKAHRLVFAGASQFLEEEIAKLDNPEQILTVPMSDGGLIVPPPGFMARLAALCRRHGILVVAPSASAWTAIASSRESVVVRAPP